MHEPGDPLAPILDSIPHVRAPMPHPAGDPEDRNSAKDAAPLPNHSSSSEYISSCVDACCSCPNIKGFLKQAAEELKNAFTLAQEGEGLYGALEEIDRTLADPGAQVTRDDISDATSLLPRPGQEPTGEGNENVMETMPVDPC